jgi:hypothetical protein
MPLRDERFLEIGYFAKNPKSPQSREREQVQCLGDMPWLSRATAVWPDAFYVADARAIFKNAAANN